jgi:hypothetical protein
MSSNVDYRSHGGPLETYELTRRDHQDQNMAEGMRVDVERRAAEWRAEEAADPELREARNKSVRHAWDIINASTTPDYQLMRWRVRLYCGHIVETRRHCEVEQPKAHGSSSMRCPDCGMDPAAIVAYEPIGTLGKPPAVVTAPQPKRPTRKALEERVAQLEAELVAMKRHLKEPPR